eukprot:103110-Rhodomonas_salina.2
MGCRGGRERGMGGQERCVARGRTEDMLGRDREEGGRVGSSRGRRTCVSDTAEGGQGGRREDEAERRGRGASSESAKYKHEKKEGEQLKVEAIAAFVDAFLAGDKCAACSLL